jgi:hypothetical protein
MKGDPFGVYSRTAPVRFAVLMDAARCRRLNIVSPRAFGEEALAPVYQRLSAATASQHQLAMIGSGSFTPARAGSPYVCQVSTLPPDGGLRCTYTQAVIWRWTTTEEHDYFGGFAGDRGPRQGRLAWRLVVIAILFSEAFRPSVADILRPAYTPWGDR